VPPATGLQGLKILCKDNGVWDIVDTRVAGLAVGMNLSLKERNWAVLKQFRDVQFDQWLPVQDATPFHLDEARLPLRYGDTDTDTATPVGLTLGSGHAEWKRLPILLVGPHRRSWRMTL
jgi:hypothetical protein